MQIWATTTSRSSGGATVVVVNQFNRAATVGDGIGKQIKFSAKIPLEAYPWNGNVRELENIIERVVALT
jgi:DNA-binding NtrC family response regulator